MIIKIKAHPNSSKQEINKRDEESYDVYLKKPAYEGRANKELVKSLKKYFKSEIIIIKGQNSKNKLIEVKNGN